MTQIRRPGPSALSELAIPLPGEGKCNQVIPNMAKNLRVAGWLAPLEWQRDLPGDNSRGAAGWRNLIGHRRILSQVFYLPANSQIIPKP